MIVDMIDYRFSDGLCAIATHGYGIWTSTFTSAVAVSRLIELANAKNQPEVALYPNPVTENSVLSIELKKTASVSLRIIDATGKILGEVNNLELPEGKHTYPVPAKGLASGIYFCTIQSGNFQKTLRFVIAE